MNKHNIKKSAGWMARGALLLGSLLPGLAASDDTVSSITGTARSSGLMLVPGKPDRLNFTFGGQFTAWLSPTGEWRMEGVVYHNGALCGTYQAGMRFGRGNPGCTDVQWLTDPDYVTSELQCNNAERNHSGGDMQPVLAENYASITCAERLILCSGNCK